MNHLTKHKEYKFTIDAYQALSSLNSPGVPPEISWNTALLNEFNSKELGLINELIKDSPPPDRCLIKLKTISAILEEYLKIKNPSPEHHKFLAQLCSVPGVPSADALLVLRCLIHALKHETDLEAFSALMQNTKFHNSPSRMASRICYDLHEKKKFQQAIAFYQLGARGTHQLGASGTHGDGWTELHSAARFGNKDFAEILLKDGKQQAATRYGLFPLHLALLHGYENTALLLINYPNCGLQNQCTLRGWKPIHYAAMNGCFDVIKRIAESSQAEINVRNRENYTPLATIFTYGDPNHALAFLKYKPDLHYTYDNGNTALHIAVDKGCVAVATKLLEQGANWKAQNYFNVAPLFLACNRDTEIIKRLIKDQPAEQVKEEINRLNLVGRAPIHCAARAGKLGVLKLLIEHGGNPMLRTKPQENHNLRFKSATQIGWTPLQYAIRSNHKECIQYLLDQGDYSNCRIEMICHAAQYANLENFKTICSRLKLIKSDKLTNIWHRIFANHDQAVYAYWTSDLGYSIPINAHTSLDEKHKTPWHHACKHGNDYLIDHFSQNSVVFFDIIDDLYFDESCTALNMNSVFFTLMDSVFINLKTLKDIDGNTPSHCAAKGGSQRLWTKFNIANNPTLANSDGHTCRMLAAKYGHQSLLDSMEAQPNKLDMERVYIYLSLVTKDLDGAKQYADMHKISFDLALRTAMCEFDDDLIKKIIRHQQDTPKTSTEIALELQETEYLIYSAQFQRLDITKIKETILFAMEQCSLDLLKAVGTREYDLEKNKNAFIYYKKAVDVGYCGGIEWLHDNAFPLSNDEIDQLKAIARNQRHHEIVRQLSLIRSRV